MAERKKKGRIPNFKSIEEEAEFWDTHSLADYEDELQPTSVRSAQNLTRPVNVRLDPKTLEEIRALAHNMGIGPTTLIRMWILERLKETEKHSTRTF